MAGKAFIETLRRHAKQVIKLEDTAAKDFLGILKQTEFEIVGRLSGLSTGDTPFNAMLLNRILGEVKVAIGTLENKAQGFYSDVTDDAVDLSVQHTVDEITRLSSSLDGVGLDLSLGASAGLSDPAQALLANHFETSVQKYGLAVLNQVRQRIQIGMITGEPTSAVVGDVQGAISGTKWKAEQIVRTETSNVYGAAQHRSIKEAAKEVPGLKKVWIHQSSYICKTCMPLNGTERPIDGTWTIKIGKRTKKVAHAPAHPNCTCRVAAMKASWRDKLEKLGYLESQDPDAGSSD